VTPQQEFFERKVLPVFEGGVKRVFVLISDAFRFEVAHELTQQINSKKPLQGIAGCHAGCIAKLHRAGHGGTAAAPGAGVQGGANLDVLADGHPVATLDQRGEHLKTLVVSRSKPRT
jgi:hypothetical protein